VFEWAEAAGPGTVPTCLCALRALSVGCAAAGPESRFDLRFSNPADLHAALRHPRVPIVVPHSRRVFP